MTFVDDTAVNGNTYYYRVVAWGADGASGTAGPVAGSAADFTPPPAPTLGATAGDGQVDLLPGLSGVADELGVFIERSDASSGKWVRLNGAPTSASLYNDDTVLNGVDYAYRAVAIDDDGNESAASPVIWAIPSADGYRLGDEVIAYEDMLGDGQNDWDYNDFVVRIQTRESLDLDSNLTRLEIDYEPLARGAGYVHVFRHRISISGDWTARLRHFDPDDPQLVVLDEVIQGTGPADIPVYGDTRDALPAVIGSYSNTDSDQASYLAGTSASLEILVATPTSNSDGSYGSAPFDPYLHLPYLPPPGEIHLGDRGGAVEFNQLSGPLQNAYLDFGLRFKATGPAWPFEGEPIWRVFPEFDDNTLLPTEETESWNDRPLHNNRVFHRGRNN
jgi:LruC domain-containing protein